MSSSVLFVVDIDGTICNSTPRAIEVNKSIGMTDLDDLGNMWPDGVMEEFLREENVMLDEVISGSERLFSIADRCNAKIVFLTGRSDYSRRATRRWLSERFNAPNNTPLFMRPPRMKGNYSAYCKEEIFKEQVLSIAGPNATYIFFEDRENVLKLYARYGLALKAPECWDILGDNL